MNVATVGVTATVIAAGAAIAGLLMTQTGSSTEVNQDGTANINCTVTGTSNTVQCAGKADPEAQLLADAEKSKGTPPSGNGPWAFVVVRDNGIGLKVRTTSTVEGLQIGGLAHLHPAWAVCKTRSGFDPEGNGDLWYKIKWDNRQRSTAYFESETGATGTGWVHSYYLVPINHNGNIPDC